MLGGELAGGLAGWTCWVNLLGELYWVNLLGELAGQLVGGWREGRKLKCIFISYKFGVYLLAEKKIILADWVRTLAETKRGLSNQTWKVQHIWDDSVLVQKILCLLALVRKDILVRVWTKEEGTAVEDCLGLGQQNVLSWQGRDFKTGNISDISPVIM